MPLSRVWKIRSMQHTVDVVIIDEASQSDVMALVLFISKDALVVGDHEQVSPSAVGQDLGIIQISFSSICRRTECGPLRGQISIYDLARQSSAGPCPGGTFPLRAGIGIPAHGFYDLDHAPCGSASLGNTRSVREWRLASRAALNLGQ